MYNSYLIEEMYVQFQGAYTFCPHLQGTTSIYLVSIFAADQTKSNNFVSTPQ